MTCRVTTKFLNTISMWMEKLRIKAFQPYLQMLCMPSMVISCDIQVVILYTKNIIHQMLCMLTLLIQLKSPDHELCRTLNRLKIGQILRMLLVKIYLTQLNSPDSEFTKTLN